MPSADSLVRRKVHLTTTVELLERWEGGMSGKSVAFRIVALLALAFCLFAAPQAAAA